MSYVSSLEEKIIILKFLPLEPLFPEAVAFENCHFCPPWFLGVLTVM